MRLDVRASWLPLVASFAFLMISPQALAADDDDDIWEMDDKCDEEDDSDDEYQNSLYDSQTYTWTTELHQMTYDAELAPARRVRVLARVSDAPGERPVVVVSHGGGRGLTNPATVLTRWSDYFADHGYTVVTIAHPPRTSAQIAALCTTFDLPEGPDCNASHSWDRPYDVEQVLNFIEAQAAGPWAGRVDTDQIALMGHSAGATGALMVGGGTRQVGVRVLDHADDRIATIIATSPAGLRPDNGLSEDSWKDIEVPVLIVTGAADITDANQPADFRMDAFRGLQEEEDNRRLFIDSAGASHSFFALNARACRQAVGDAECLEMADAIQSAALAHLDAYLSADNTAKDWLENEVVDEVVTPGLADLTTREDIDGFGD